MTPLKRVAVVKPALWLASSLVLLFLNVKAVPQHCQRAEVKNWPGAVDMLTVHAVESGRLLHVGKVSTRAVQERAQGAGRKTVGRRESPATRKDGIEGKPCMRALIAVGYALRVVLSRSRLGRLGTRGPQRRAALGRRDNSASAASLGSPLRRARRSAIGR